MTEFLDVLRETRGACALLEGGGMYGPLSRRSLLARNPRAVVLAGRGEATVTTAQGVRSWAGDPLDLLRELLKEVPSGSWPQEGGIVGALAYDYARPSSTNAVPLLVALVTDRFDVLEDGHLYPAAEGRPLDAVLGFQTQVTPGSPIRPLDLARYSNLTC